MQDIDRLITAGLTIWNWPLTGRRIFLGPQSVWDAPGRLMLWSHSTLSLRTVTAAPMSSLNRVLWLLNSIWACMLPWRLCSKRLPCLRPVLWLYRHILPSHREECLLTPGPFYSEVQRRSCSAGSVKAISAIAWLGLACWFRRIWSGAGENLPSLDLDELLLELLQRPSWLDTAFYVHPTAATM